MKKIFIPFALALLITACGTTKEEKNLSQKERLDKIQNLKKRGKKLKKQLAKINDSIMELEAMDENFNIPLVQVEKVSKEDFSHYFKAQAVIKSDRNISINAEFSGVVDEVYVTEGSKINVGQSILKLNTDIIDQQIVELKKGIELAEYVYEKQERLHQQEIGSELEYKQAKNNLASLKEKLKTLNTQRSKATVKAPFNGYIDEIYTKKGSMAMTGTPTARILNLDKVKAHSDISEKYLPYVKKGSYVRVEFPVLNKTFDSLKVSRVGKLINPNNRTFPIEIELPKNDASIVPNLIAKVVVRDLYEKDVIVIPSKAIMQDNQGNNFVYVVIDNKVVRKDIVPGKSYSGKSVVKEGIEVNDQVIFIGNRGVRPGENIRIIK